MLGDFSKPNDALDEMTKKNVANNKYLSYCLRMFIYILHIKRSS